MDNKRQNIIPEDQIFKINDTPQFFADGIRAQGTEFLENPAYRVKKKTEAKKAIDHQKNIKIAVIVLLSIMVVAIIFAVFMYFLNQPINKIDDTQIDEQLITPKPNTSFYTLLVGTDTREEEGTYQYENGRADTCVLLRIDPVNAQLTMVSIPRDTKVVIDGTEQKINAAYNFRGIAGMIEQVKVLCGVEISHYVEISFNGLKDMVDAVGGVEVNVPETIVGSRKTINPGRQIIDGETALLLSRSRKFSDGDFTRTEDQRILLEALFTKGFKLPLSNLSSAYNIIRPYIRTDFTFAQVLDLANIFKDKSKMTVYSAMVPSTTSYENGISYVITDKEALLRMMAMVEAGEDPSMVEITSGAVVSSRRNTEDIAQKQAEYYSLHPNSPGRIQH